MQDNDDDDVDFADLTAFPEFDRYMDRFITYYPKKPYHTKHGYNKGFIQQNHKTTGNPRALGGKYLTEVVERHLYPDLWSLKKDRPKSPFWLGLHIPKKCRDSCIDLDAKTEQLTTYTRKLDGYPKDGITYPIACPTVNHLQRMKRIYDNFPNRIWCISSKTLGLHIWEAFDYLIDPREIHDRDKTILASLGMGDVEVHPMQGRCLRRPFGADYVVITPEGSLTMWQDQITYYLDDRRTPSFGRIVYEMLQYAKRGYREGTCLHSNLAKFPNQFNERYRKALDWFQSGCPMQKVESPKPINVNVTTERIEPQSIVAEDNDLRCPYSVIDELPQWLEWHAVNGLGVGDTFSIVALHLIRHLFWIERIDPERIKQLVLIWVTQKHNGRCSRIPSNMNGVEREIDHTIETVKANALDHLTRAESLERFAITRQKRERGDYPRNIDIAACMQPTTKVTFSFGGHYNSPPPKQLELPPDIIIQITQFAKTNKCRMKQYDDPLKQYEYPLIRFARPFLNLIWDNKGKRRINLATCLAYAGSKDEKFQSRYKKQLAEIGLIKPGWEKKVSRGRSLAALYELTPLAMSIFQQHHQAQQETAWSRQHTLTTPFLNEIEPPYHTMLLHTTTYPCEDKPNPFR